MNEYWLILFQDGDIAIFRGHGSNRVSIYHKTYNIGDSIQDNLLKAYKLWEDLT